MYRKLILPFALATLATTLYAQQPQGLEPIPEPPPPPPAAAGEDLEPEVTITKRGEDTVEEYRIRGKRYMVKVTPPHGVPYYLIDPKGDGVLVPYQDMQPTLSVPMWVIRSW